MKQRFCMAFIIVLVMCILMPATAFAAKSDAEPLKKGTLIYTDTKAHHMVYKVTSSNKKNPTVAFYGTFGHREEIIIPPYTRYGGVKYTVTSVAANALNGYTVATSISVGKNVKKIGKKAFANCDRLEQLRIVSEELTEVGDDVLKNDDNLTLVKTRTHDIKALFKDAIKDAGLEADLM